MWWWGCGAGRCWRWRRLGRVIWSRWRGGSRVSWRRRGRGFWSRRRWGCAWWVGGGVVGGGVGDGSVAERAGSGGVAGAGDDLDGVAASERGNSRVLAVLGGSTHVLFSVNPGAVRTQRHPYTTREALRCHSARKFGGCKPSGTRRADGRSVWSGSRSAASEAGLVSGSRCSFRSWLSSVRTDLARARSFKRLRPSMHRRDRRRNALLQTSFPIRPGTSSVMPEFRTRFARVICVLQVQLENPRTAGAATLHAVSASFLTST